MLSLFLLLLQRHCTTYESSDKDEEGKRQGTRKSEADEEDDDYPAANSLDLIKICFSLQVVFSFLCFHFFFLLFSSSTFSCLLWHGVAWVARAALVICMSFKMHLQTYFEWI